jgi:hypothetical protein
MQKKNSKLESFLFRKLPEHRYERIRGYESCIVVSERENKAFKYVILGDEWIYLTENPPKTIQESVALGDVISVELVGVIYTCAYIHVCTCATVIYRCAIYRMTYLYERYF